MDSPTYIKNALRTESVPVSIEIHQVGLAVIMKLAELSGKMVDKAKRKIFYNQTIDKEELAAMAMQMSEGAATLANAIMFTEDVNIRVNDEEYASEDLDLNRVDIRMLHAAFGCFTESAELIETVIAQYMGQPFDAINFGEEIGDIEWYQAIGFDASGVTEASCREKNIAKLRARYPEKFNAEQAINRDLDAERKTLE